MSHMHPLLKSSIEAHGGLAQAHSEDAVMIGDRRDTDIISGVEAGMETTLVLTGVTRRENVARYSFLPTRIVDSVADLEP